MNAFPPWPSFTQEEADAVAEVLLSNKVNQWTGTAVADFEDAFAEFCGSRHAVAFSNGTTALDAALHAVAIRPGDEVVVTPRSFVASASSVVMAGAMPIFADVDRDSQVITPDSVDALLTERTRAIVCVHLAGWPCDMAGFRDLVAGRDIALIEDCAQAHGAMVGDKSVGTLGDIAAWSFCQDKIITTGGEGGMITTNDDSYFRTAWSYKDHGKSYESVFEKEHPPGFRWLHDDLGTNARMTSMQAVIGKIQLGRLNDWHLRRTERAQRIYAAAQQCPGLRVPVVPPNLRHAWYKCYLFVRPERLRDGWSRDRILSDINKRGVPCFSGACPEIYRERAFVSRGLVPGKRLEAAKELGETSLMFLVHPTLREEEMQQTCSVLIEVMDTATAR